MGTSLVEFATYPTNTIFIFENTSGYHDAPFSHQRKNKSKS
jgi:hypothetical protein